ncbi:hypothetical protein [Natranaerovirga hydrolytica]|uniref:hypothetical protein n=1 Tax=Natranaerovirga hydrolytica TaxID=680378 RepID=UPI001051FE36|nr:hypothetical protein [Natranaerovirga hydrolytica]
MQEQFMFYLPLATTAFFMLLTHTLYNAGLSRLPQPELYLAAFAVAKSLNNMFMGPINMIKQTVIALADNKDNYRSVKKFVIIMSSIASLAYITVAVSGMGQWVFKNLMSVDDNILDIAVTILKVVMLSSITISFRDFYQGIAIKFKKTYLIPIGTFLRLFYVLGIIIFAEKITFVSAAVVAGSMHLGATLVEALVMFLGTKLSLKNIPRSFEKLAPNKEHMNYKILNYRYILSFFIPLALTSIMKMTAQPIINTGLARTLRPEIALSTYAIAWGLGMNILSPLNMFHQVPLKFLNKEDNKNYKPVIKFAVIIGVLLTTALVIIAFTNVGDFILRKLIEAPEEVIPYSLEALRVMCLIPIIRVGREFYWGLFMKNHMTHFIRSAKIISLVALMVSIVFTLYLRIPNPALIGVIAMLVSETVEFLYLLYIYYYKKIYSL